MLAAILDYSRHGSRVAFNHYVFGMAWANVILLSRAPGGRSSLPDPTVWFQSPYCMVPKQPLLYGSQQAKLLTKKLLSLPCKDAVRLREAPTNIHITNMNAANHVHARRLIFQTSVRSQIQSVRQLTPVTPSCLTRPWPHASCDNLQSSKIDKSISTSLSTISRTEMLKGNRAAVRPLPKIRVAVWIHTCIHVFYCPTAIAHERGNQCFMTLEICLD